MIDVEKRKHVYGRKIGGLFGSLFAFSSLARFWLPQIKVFFVAFSLFFCTATSLINKTINFSVVHLIHSRLGRLTFMTFQAGLD